ncbi:MAG TPA: glycosyl hydrolase family 18 protein [Acidobacteriaceae bacterium]
MKRLLPLLILLLAPAAFAASHPVALFYMTNDPTSIRDFFAHSSQIDILVPGWYDVDENGLVTGEPEPAVLRQAQSEKLPVMPIVGLTNKAKFHLLGENAAAQAQMNAALIRECRLHGYMGFQLDIEDISWTDRDALSALVKRTADVLHGAGLQLSIATVPNAPGYPGSGGFAKWIYTDWRGAYDLAALAKSADLICLMTYDQNTHWTMPGPVAGWQWTIDNMKYALQFVPKDKLSLGIPVYGYHWYTGAPIVEAPARPGEAPVEKPNPTADYIGAPDAELLAHDWGGKIQWDADDHTAWFYINRDQMREWVFFTDLHTFRDRYDLVQQNGLEGFCSWVLGQEDPKIWTVLPQRQAGSAAERVAK